MTVRIWSGLMALVALGYSGSSSQTPEQLFQQGNMQYQQGNLAAAKDLYEKILASGYVSGDLYYNLGNTFYRAGDIPRAILTYERALRLMPQDEDLRHNLQLANLSIADRIEPTPRLFFWDSWDGLKSAFSLRGATWAMYIPYLMMLGSLTVVMLARRYRVKRIALVASVACAAGFLFLLMVFIARVNDSSRTDDAIVMAAIATVKNSPDVKSSDAFVLHGGVKVRILDSVSDWLSIRLADGKVGWIEKSAVEVI